MLAVFSACYHESGHAVAALRYNLPLRAVFVRDDDGTGTTRYEHWFGRAELDAWIVTAFAGSEAERDRFPGHPADEGDQRAIEAALKACNLDWSAHRLDELRADAHRLVRAERRSILAVANELLRVRSLTACEVRRIVG